MSTGVQRALSQDKASSLCVNCETLLEGEYCHECGEKQPHDHDLTVAHFAHEAWHEIIHVDSKIWRTLEALVLQPGALTVEYRAGRRNRYMRPLRMYLILFAGFVLLYSMGAKTKTFDVERILEAEVKRNATSGNPFGFGTASPQSPAPANSGNGASGGPTVNFKAGSPVPTGSRNMNYLVEKMVRKHLKSDNYGDVAPDSEVYKIARAASLERMTHNWQRFTSLLQFVQPLFLSLGLAIIFFGTKRHFVEHLVMALHLLSFQYLFSIVMWPVYYATGMDPYDRRPWMMALMIALSLGYVFLAFRKFYGESNVKTGLKSVVGYGFMFAGMVLPISIALVLALLVS